MSDFFYGVSGPYVYQFASTDVDATQYPMSQLAFGETDSDMAAVARSNPLPVASDDLRRLLELILVELRVANIQREAQLERAGLAGEFDYDASFSLAH